LRWFVSRPTCPRDHPNLRENIQRVARALHPLLLSNFLDSAPSVFTPSSGPDPTELGIVSAVADIYRNLYGPLLQSSKVRISRSSRSRFFHRIFQPSSNTGFLLDNLQVILGRMAPYFPFLLSPLARRDIQASILGLPLLHSLIPIRIRSNKHFKILTSSFVNSRPS
jgi:hypothetical protein